MTLLLRLWLGLTGLFPGLLVRAAARRHRAQGAEEARFPERLGQGLPSRGDAPVLWFHAASLGEVAQIRDLARHLSGALGARLLVTTATRTGADWVARELPEACHQYAPVDTPDAVTRFLDHWSPMAAIFVESDLWPRLLVTATRRDIPLILVNARASRTRDRLPRTMGALLRPFRLITCRSDSVARDLRALGLTPGRVVVTGDLKAAAARLPTNPDTVAQLSRQIGARPVWIAASTHAEDEAAVLAAQAILATAARPPLLIWAPRHPTRAEAIIAAARDRGLSVAQRSAGGAITPQTAIYLADTMGELGSLFPLSPVVFLGGGMGREGGHNPYEPALFGAALLSGPKVRNFADAFRGFEASGALCLVRGGDDLAREVARLLAGDAAEMGRKAQRLASGQGEALSNNVRLVLAALHDH